MLDPLWAVLFVLLAWWLSTGVILLLDGLPQATFRLSLGGVGVLALAGLYGLAHSSRIDSRAGAYLGFCSALAVWAWHELAFLLGVITGPRKAPCPPAARGLVRFRFATAALLYHELALLVTLLAVLALTRGAPNQVGAHCFVVLWVMRISAKLNVFLGVRNLATEFIPAHLGYLLSYFRKARMNPLMPVSLLLSGAVLLYLIRTPAAAGADAVGRTLVATLLGLAVLEHVFLVLPLPDALLWRWALRTRQRPQTR